MLAWAHKRSHEFDASAFPPETERGGRLWRERRERRWDERDRIRSRKERERRRGVGGHCLNCKRGISARPSYTTPPQLGSSPSSLWIPAYNCPVNYNKMEGKARNNLSWKLIKTYRPELRTFSNGRSFVIISPLSLSWERREEIKSWYLLNRRNGLKKKKRKDEKDSKTFSLFLFPLSSRNCFSKSIILPRLLWLTFC